MKPLSSIIAPLCFCSAALPVASAQTVVKVMPGYPNAPRVSPAERHQARPGTDVVLWGNVDDGSLSGLGARYEWILTLPQNVAVTTDGSLEGVVLDPDFVLEEVQFELLNGSTREIVTATLDVDNGPKGAGQSTLEIVVVAPEEFSSPAHIGNLEIDRRIAIQDGLRYLYLSQEPDGSWPDAQEPCASTAYALWAIHNQGHVPISNPNEDILMRTSERGLDYLLAATAQVVPEISAPRATAALGAIADGISDMNGNGEVINLCPTISPGYAANMALAGIVSSLAPDRVVTLGPLAGRTYRDVVIDCIDWLGASQSQGNSSWGGRGGWTYFPSSGGARSDMSINSWAYIAMEGAQEIFGLEVPAWIKKECEYSLAYQMRDTIGATPFGYVSTNHHTGDSRSQATTASGLTGIALVLTGVDPGSVLAAKGNQNVLTLEDQRANALTCLGEYWSVDVATVTGGGVRGNYYSMWTVARGLRATAASLGIPDEEVVPLVNDGVTFDWETGAEEGGVLATQGAREGLFSWLVRNQQTAGDLSQRGRWATSAYTNRPSMATSLAVLTLSRRVFLDPCPDAVTLPVTDLNLADGSRFADGVPFVLSGQVETQSVDRPIAAVFVNGQEADSLDVEGRFFAEVVLLPGPNEVEIEAYDSCGSDTTVLTLQGTEPGDDVSTFTDITPWLDVRYSGTTFNQADEILAVQAEICSTASGPIIGPLLMVFENFDAPGVEALFADGVLADGRPYYSFLTAPGVDTLAPGACTAPRGLYFRNPGREPFQFRVSWLAPSDTAPVFVTSPTVKTPPDALYRYSARAVDDQGQDVTYGLIAAPSTMALDTVTGEISWSPLSSDVGLHQVVLEASDGVFGRAEQRWTLEVTEIAGDQPPFFISAPVTRVAVGAEYEYTAEAQDLEDDSLEYALIEGPSGLVMDTDGRLSWDFTVEGSYSVQIEARDDVGGTATQGWLLAVGSVSSNPNAPSLTGNPGVIATVERPYLYQPLATDLDLGDVLTFRLLESPVGMTIDSVTGRIAWTPGSAQIGPHIVELEVDDGQSGTASQAWTIEVFTSPPNAPPVVLSLPPTLSLIGETYEYQVLAFDPDQDAIGFSLETAPTGMVIDGATGLVSWMPASEGSFTVAIKVEDGPDASGSFGSQVYDLVIGPPNQAPSIVSTPSTEIPAGVTWYYDLNAIDPEGQSLRYESVSAPAGLEIDENSGIVRWSTDEGDVGVVQVQLTATDPYGAQDQQSFSLTVAEDTLPPVVEIVATPTPAALDEPLSLCVVSSDDVGVEDVTLSLDGVDLPLDENDCAVITPGALGVLELDASAIDAAGNFALAELDVQVIDPNDTEAPVLELASPAPGSTVRGPVEITGSILDNQPGSLVWDVKVARRGADLVREIATGTGNVAGGVLARFDPTNLPNDTYEVTITADDGVNGARFIQFNLAVTGDYKLGNYSTAFVDAVVPLNGFPMVLGREYSSLETELLDFGSGWRITLPGDLRDAAVEGDFGFDGAYRLDERVYLSLFDGQRRAFRVRLQPIPFFVGAFVSFEPEDGTEGELRLADPSEEFAVPVGGALFTPFQPYNPDEFVYTDSAGVEFFLSESEGLTRIVDIYGGVIDVNDNGLVSSQGPAIEFGRNSEGLIETVTLPDPTPGDGQPAPVLNYAHDSMGRLVAFTDADGVTTTFLYEDSNFPRYLTSIIDPLGRPAVRNKLDDEGRLIAQCGPDADFATCEGCLAMQVDAFAEFQTIFTGDGERVDLFLDSNGQVLVERHWLQDAINFEITRTYDENGFVVLEQESGGATWVFERNAEGQWTRLVDPSGNEWLRSFNADGELESIVEPDGDTYTLGFDEDSQLTEIFDPLGQRFQFTYTEFGQLETSTDHEGATWTLLYGPLGQPSGFIDPDGNMESYIYDALGRLTFSEDRMGQVIDFTYTSGGRPESEMWSSGEQLSFAYNDAGLVETVIDADSRLSFSYWPDGKLRSLDTAGTADAPAFQVVYGLGDISNPTSGYDGKGNVASVLDSFGGQTTYAWDSLLRIRSIEQRQIAGSGNLIAGGVRDRGTQSIVSGGSTSSGSTIRPKRLSFAYVGNDGVDRRVLERVERFGGDQATVPHSTTEYGYSVPGSPSLVGSILHQDSAGATLHEITYARDSEGTIRSWFDAEGAHAVVVDGLKRILSIDHPAGSGLIDESYEYDGNDNRVSSHLSSTYDVGPVSGAGSDKIRSDSRFDYEHDLNGSLVLRTERSTGATVALGYDFRRRLVSIRERDGSGPIVNDLEIRYDGLSRKIRSTLNGVAKHYFYDGLNPILITDDAGAVLERRLYGRDLDDLLALERSGETLWPLKDAVGTVRDWVDESGTIRFHPVRDSFGNPVVASIAPSMPTIGFQSLETHGVAGLLDVRARSYSPWLGRFTAEDPEGLWAYAGFENNPLIYRDPMGTSVIVEYACLASFAVGFANAIAEAYHRPAARVFYSLGAFLGDPSAENLAAAQSAASSFRNSVILGPFNIAEDLAEGAVISIIDDAFGCGVTYGQLIGGIVNDLRMGATHYR